MDRLRGCKNNVRRGWSKDIEETLKYFNLPGIYTLEVKLTNKCSMGCSYCYACSTECSTQRMSKKTIFSLIEDACECGVQQINWGGGEPLERDDWRDMMEFARDLGLRNLVMTNGMFLSDKKILSDFTKLVDMTTVHIDTFDAKIWEKIHNFRKNMLGLQVSGVENLIKSGFDVDDMALCMTITKPLFEGQDYKKTIDRAYDVYGISAIMYPFREFGMGKAHQNLNASREDIACAYKYRNEKDGIPSGPGFGSKIYCATSCHVGAQGELFGCSMVLPSYVGNIHKFGFKDLYERNIEKLTYHKLKEPSNIQGKCSSCVNNTFCWGCRGASDIVCGDFAQSDPFCWM